jgi:hypothetical protein
MKFWKKHQTSQFKVLPVLLMSEILLDEKELENHCQKCHHILHNKLYEVAIEKYEHHDKILDNLSKEFNLFDVLHEKTSLKLKDVVSLLEKWNQYYLINPPRFDEEKENAVKIKHNLIDRHNLVEKLLEALNYMTSKKEELKNILVDVEKMNKYYDSIFEEVEMVIE